MTAIKRKRVMTIETWQRTVIRQSPRRIVWCEFCAAQVETLAPEQAALLDMDLNEIQRRIENGSLHFVETGNGNLLICRQSLMEN